MELTKEQAIKEHRKMWNWIANQIENNSLCSVHELKKLYMRINGFDTQKILNNCFCCEYSFNKTGDLLYHCKNCPLIWGSEQESFSWYCETFDANSWSTYSASNARRIANLKEKEVL